ncbi:hypothetical protein FAY30_23310 [Bacillus sp. S3]|uniref:RNA polymerase sigma factor n=1 Tax=Bacillus sp. S3 TaxID=486398 RepID=UPI001188D738|nr:sigma factor-like helix-turn-helix DNA-binding protein [Bacillus sp. S3]QCJ44582.1 hypothetical protein FAY30_23310 [Bacillus sp. S3]
MLPTNRRLFLSSIERNYLASEESRLIINFVKQLKTKYQSVIVLFYFQEMSVKEISETLGILIGGYFFLK